MKTWINKGYTEEEAKYQIAIRRPSNILYYINKGYSEEEAVLMMKQHQSRGGEKRSKMSVEEKRALSPRCVEFYLSRGFETEQAKDLVKEFQASFSKKKCIEKYGEVEGLKIFKDRQERWQATLSAKSKEEIDDINRRKNAWKDKTEEQSQQIKDKIRKSIDAFWDSQSTEYRIEHGNKIRETFVEIGKAIAIEELDEWRAYAMLVDRVTRCQPINTLTNFENRGPKNFHLDHKYSKLEGFKNKISPDVIGHICNLEMIPYNENTSKRDKCSITLETLLEDIKKHNDNT